MLDSKSMVLSKRTDISKSTSNTAIHAGLALPAHDQP